MNTILSNSTINIQFIHHLADIHIRLDSKRHTEYNKVFHKLYKKISEHGGNESLIVICGDLLHSKLELSPECLKITIDFLKNLSNISPLIIIAGNHDFAQNNSGRLDSITPIVQEISSTYPIHYLKYSGIYEYNNLVFGVSSLIDNQFIKASQIKSNKVKIGLYHGSVAGSVDFVGYRLKNYKYTVDDFKGYQYVLLGDIHKHQTLRNGICYPSSLIQQNHGESLEEHGYVLWDLVQKNSTFINIPNSYGYITINIDNGEYDLIDIPKRPRIRFILKNTSHSDFESIKSTISERHQVQELICEEKLCDNAKVNNIKINIDNLDYQKSMIRDYCIDLNLGESIKNKVLEFHDKIIATLGDYDRNIQSTWSISYLTFSNMFCYGKNNEINFEKMNGITGIVAKNGVGKSSIFDVILYALFNKCTKGDRINVINNNSRSYQCKVTLKINGKSYLIERSGELHPTRRELKEQVSFYKMQKTKLVSLNGKDRLDTNNIIANYIGSYDNCVLTTFCLQNEVSFINYPQAKKKEFLSKIFGLELFEKIHTIAKKKYNTILAKYKIFSKNDIIAKGDNIYIEKNKCDAELLKLDDYIKKETNKICSLEKELKIKRNNIYPINTILDISDININKLCDYKKQIKNINKAISLKESKLEDILEECVILQKKIAKYNKKVSTDIKKCILEQKENYDKNTEDKILLLSSKKNNMYTELKTVSNLHGDYLNGFEYLNDLKNINLEICCLENELYQTLIKMKGFENTILNLKMSMECNDNDEILRNSKIKVDSLYSKIKPAQFNNIRDLEDSQNDLEKKLRNAKNQLDDLILFLETEQKHLNAVENEFASIDLNKLYTYRDNLKTSSELYDLNMVEINRYVNKINIILENSATDLIINEELTFCIDCTHCQNNKAILNKNSLIEKENKIAALYSKLHLLEQRSISLLKDKNSLLEYEKQIDDNNKIKEYIDVKKIEIKTINENINSKRREIENMLSKQLEYNNDFKTFENNLLLRRKIEEQNKIISSFLDNSTQKKYTDAILEIQSLDNFMKRCELDLEKKNNKRDAIVINLEKVMNMNKLKFNNDRNIEENKIVMDNINKINQKIKFLSNKTCKDYEEYIRLENKLTTLVGLEKDKNIEELVIKSSIKEEYIKKEHITYIIKNIELYIQKKEENLKTFEEIDKILNSISVCRKKIDEYTHNMITCNNKKSCAENDIKNYEDVMSKLDTLKEEKLIMEKYVEIVDKSGVPYKILKMIVPKMKDEINMILSSIVNFNVDVCLDDDKISIYRLSADKKLGIESCCGFEKFIIGFATRLTLSKLSNVNNNSNLVIDEGLSCLDFENINSLDPLYNYLRQNFKYVILISHIQHIRGSCDDVIDIIRNERTNKSCVKY